MHKKGLLWEVSFPTAALSIFQFFPFHLTHLPPLFPILHTMTRGCGTGNLMKRSLSLMKANCSSAVTIDTSSIDSNHTLVAIAADKVRCCIVNQRMSLLPQMFFFWFSLLVPSSVPNAQRAFASVIFSFSLSPSSLSSLVSLF